MSSIHGKNSLSFRRVKTDENSSSSATISNDYKFAHKASAGETQIDLLSLVNPPEMPSFVNPTGTQLTAINLKANKNSFILISSLRGTLISELSYQINTSKIITLNFVAAEGEIFTGQLRTTQATANVVDAQTYIRTGTLLAGQTDIALGQAFNQNAFPTSQIGEVMLHIDGVLQFRNVDNATAVPLADGNYEEVSAGNGLTNVLRLNDVFGVDVAWAVTSTGLIVDQSGNNNQQQLDSLAGQIDALIPTVASLAGVPETNFQAGPNSVDLKAFADKLYQACQDIITNNITSEAGDAALEASKQDKILVAYLKDIKLSGTSGGTFTAGAWQTRDLNTIEGDNIVSLSGNQFTLQKGKYTIEAEAPAIYVGKHKTKLRNITEGTDSIIGTSEDARVGGTGTDLTNVSTLKGVIVLSESKTFELQHRCASTHAASGLGAATSFGVDEIYAQVKITKIE